MSKIHKFLNQSAYETQGRVGAYAPELRGNAVEVFGMPLLLGAFTFAMMAALAIAL